MGVFRHRCMDLETGIYNNNGIVCGSVECPVYYTCVPALNNPGHGVIHHDNLFMSLYTIFQIITLEGWTYNMQLVQQAQSYYNFMFYLPLVFITAYLVEEFTKVIISISFTRVYGKLDNEENGKIQIIPDSIFQTIYRNSINSYQEQVEFNQNFQIFRKKPEEIESDINLSHKYRNNDLKIEIISEERMEKDSLIPSSQEIYKKNINNYFELEKDFCFANILDSNSLNIKKKRAINRESTFNKLTQESFMKNEGDAITEMHQDLKFSKKDQKIYEQLKKSAGIHKKILNKLLKDPSKVEKSRIQISESYYQFSNSTNDIQSITIKPFYINQFKFVYSMNNELLDHNKLLIEKKIKKFSEFSDFFTLFNYLSLKKNKRIAFKKLANPGIDFLKIHRQEEPKSSGVWSGTDVVNDPEKNSKELLNRLSDMSYRLWSEGILGYWEKFKYPIKYLILHKMFEYFMLMSVLANTGALAYDHHGISQEAADALIFINEFFTFLFTAELTLKIIGLGLKEYLRDPLNYFDSIVVCISLIEIIISSDSSGVNAFRVVRIFRIFRVLRIIRLFRYMKSLSHIVDSIVRSIPDMGYLGLLLLLFQLIFTLINMQVFGGTMNFPEGLPRANFDTFHWSFITTFQLLSTENFNDPFASALRSTAGLASGLLPIIWVLIGHFVLLNLVLGILLGSFENDSKQQQEDIEILRRKKINFTQKLEIVENFNDSDSDASFVVEHKKTPIITEILGSNHSFYLFSKRNFIRKFCWKINSNQYFDKFFLFIIIISCIKLT